MVQVTSPFHKAMTIGTLNGKIDCSKFHEQLYPGFRVYIHYFFLEPQPGRLHELASMAVVNMYDWWIYCRHGFILQWRMLMSFCLCVAQLGS